MEAVAACKQRPARAGGRVRVLTHCNTGSLATAAYGTALGVMRALHEQEKLEQAYCTETRPYNQGGYPVGGGSCRAAAAQCRVGQQQGQQGGGAADKRRVAAGMAGCREGRGKGSRGCPLGRCCSAEEQHTASWRLGAGRHVPAGLAPDGCPRATTQVRA